MAGHLAVPATTQTRTHQTAGKDQDEAYRPHRA